MPQQPLLRSSWQPAALRPSSSAAAPGSAAARCSTAARCFLLALAGATWGCDLGSFGDLGEKLLDPEVQGLDVPGERWLTGAHYDLRMPADENGSRFALARSAEGELSIIDFSQGVHCRAGVVARYDEPVMVSGEPALIPLLMTDDAGSRLGFTDFKCQRRGFEVAVGGLPLTTIEGLGSGSGTSLLVKTPAQGLMLVDPWSESTQMLAESVRNNDPVAAFGHFLWVDRGVIAISDSELVPVAFFGQDVAEVIISAEDRELAYVERPGAGPGGTLFVVNATGTDAPRELASDVCSIRYLTLEGRRQLSYLSPCAARTLVFRDRANDSVRVIAEGVAGPPAVRNVGGESLMTYVTTPDSETSIGTLWAVRGNAEPIVIAEDTRVGPSAVSGGGELLAILDWSNSGGRMVAWKDEALTDVADGVIEIDPLGRLADGDLTLLGNYDGVTGELLRLKPDLSTELIAERVPTRAANGDAFLANFDGTAGELMLLDRAQGSTELLATGVARGSFIFAQQWSAIMMLSGRDEETRTSTLRMRLLSSDREFLVHDGVTEAREVAFPSPGLLYNVVIGDAAGVWFSKAL